MRRFTITCFTGRDLPVAPGGVVVAVDVIRATTTAVTAIAAGRRCLPVTHEGAALALRAREPEALLVGELGGDTPEGFDLGNSPSVLAARDDYERPVILMSSSGTQLMCAEGFRRPLYVGCLRNWRATADHLASTASDVLLAGAGTRGEFRVEDQVCCARIGASLLAWGFVTDPRSCQLVEQWSSADVDVIALGHSAAFLRKSGQAADLDFILSHVNDVTDACMFNSGEITKTAASDTSELALAS